MSAFIVSERTMHRAVHALVPQDAPCAACDELGHQLYRLKAQAVMQRFGRPEDGPEYRHAVVFPPLIQQLKSLNCLYARAVVAPAWRGRLRGLQVQTLRRPFNPTGGTQQGRG
jgi:hypothetical protein